MTLIPKKNCLAVLNRVNHQQSPECGLDISTVKDIQFQNVNAYIILFHQSSCYDGTMGMQLASHGLFDVHVKATGDIHIDDHHTNEDVALAIGTALLQTLGDRKGINRFGDFSAPLDEALIHVSLWACKGKGREVVEQKKQSSAPP
ncbi:hypothetical protein VNO78_19367 [Psophocarpus tetragonolobus]|uniref:imidazoleglycerol-phosphate dehydratase n=1 Tax=Psophocarpus tetragonolobus TaxID=3891 RepID=A0AAN9S8J9_PSOTE